MTRTEKIIGAIAVSALGISILAFTRREVEIRAIAEVTQIMEDLRTDYRFANIVDQYGDD